MSKVLIPEACDKWQQETGEVRAASGKALVCLACGGRAGQAEQPAGQGAGGGPCGQLFSGAWGCSSELMGRRMEGGL